MNFAQVCGAVTCAVTAFVGCGDDREAVGTNGSSSSVAGVRSPAGTALPDTPRAAPIRITTASTTPAEITLLSDPRAPQTGARVVTGFTQGAHGSVSLIGGRAIYTPAPGYAGGDSFRYTVSDAAGTSSSSTVSVMVAAAAPTCSITISGPSTVVIGTPIHLTAVATCTVSFPEIQWLHRTGTSGTFTVFQNFSAATTADFPTGSAALGTHQFFARVRAHNTFTRFNSNTISVTLNTGNAPIAVDDDLVVDEDQSGRVDVLANDSDPDGDPLTATIVTAPAAGTATIAAGVVTYTPAADYHGSDAVGYQISDGHGNTAAATVHVTVNSINDPPSAQHDFLTVAEDGSGSLDVTANDSDVDGDTPTVVDLSQPAHGTATRDGNLVTYVPDADYSGADELEYTIDDGHGATSTASVFVTVTAGNDPPIAVDDELTTAEDTLGGVYLLGNDTDPDGDTLTVVAFTQPAHGSVSVVAGLASYVPDPDYHGPDAFDYTVADPAGATATATVHITVTAVNDAPVAVDDAAGTDEDTVATVDVVADDGDVDGDALTITAVTQPAHGTAAIASAHEVTYTPAADYHGADAFRYTIADPSGATATATVTLAVGGVNDPPVAIDDAAATDEDAAATIDAVANDSDVDGDALAITAVTQPAHGTAAIASAHEVTYTPAADYHGPDAFGYTISDGQGGQASATVAITVTPVNDAPVAADDAASLDEDTAATIDVAGNDSDVDGDATAITAVTQPAHGVAEIVDGRHVAYTPAANYHGPDAFGYTIDDGHGGQASATVAITVTPVNDAPVAADDAAVLLEDGSAVIDVVANDGDVDGDALAIAAITQPAHGVAVIVDATHVGYTPAANYHGPDAFSYTIDDGHGAQSSALVAITVTPVNDAPVAADDAATLPEDTTVTIDVVANDSDLDGDALAVASVTPPAHGTAAIVDATQVRYTPAANYHGPDAFGYTIDDGHGGQASATVAITVTPVNDAPIAASDAATLAEDTTVTIDVVANDSDVDGDSLEIASITQPAHGTAVIVDATQVRYTPAPNYHGPDAFSYTVGDGHGGQASATVAITVTPVNDAPVATDDTASLDEDSSITVDVVANDVDLDGDALAVASITQPAHGVALVVDGRVLYVPAANYHGPDALGYTISDGHGGQATAQLTLDVISVNDAPVAVDDTASLDEDTSATVDVVANDSDVDGDSLAVASVIQPAHGTAAIAGLHQVRYTPAANYHGPDALSYTIDDGHGGQATAQLTLDVISVNDAPVAADDTASLDEDTSATVDVVANDSDVDGDTLAVASLTQPAHGTAAIVDGQHVRYTPAANYHGPDAFGYTIDDGHGAQASATVAVTVASVNDAPVASGGALSTFDDTPAAATLAASDVDGDPLAFAIASPPAHGTLGPVVAGRVTYTPAAGFAGSDAFTFTASDGQVSSAPATVLVTVVRSVCGNGVREGVHEECDDGNATPSDGCEATCKLTCGSGTGADRDTVDAASGHCFVAYDGVQHSYQQAAAMCGAVGGHLPTITSAGEDAAALAAVRAGDTPWLGADDVAVEGTFRWLTGEPFGYSHFHAGEPDNAGSADCVQYLGDGTWSDAPCSGVPSNVTGTLCELPLAVGTPAFATGGGGTRGLAIADLNGDGYADVAAVNPANNTVGLLLGDGAGGFALAASYPTGAGPVAIAAGDFDGDGRPDLAVVNATANTLGILRGTASGAFVAGATLAIASGATSIAAADLDGDGALDLAITANATVQVLHGNGHGGFAVQGGIAITGLPASIAVGDFNRDGRIDLALTTPLAVLVVMGTGGGGFGLPVSLAVSTGNRAIVAADLDGDGNLDLAVANGAATVSLFFGSASGVFGAASNLTVAAAPQLVVTGDFDGDGGTDLVALTGGFATLFHGAGRTFTQAGPAVATGGNGASFAAAGNVNGDAAADLVVASATSSNAGVLLGGPGGLAGARALPAGTGATATASADFNEDGRADLAVVDPATSKVYVFLQTASGGLAPGVQLSPPSGGGATYLVAADFDGNGHVDLATINATFASVSVFLGTGTGAFGTALNTGTGPQPRRPAVGDFNNDGVIDLAVPSATGNLIAVLLGNGAGRFARVNDLLLAAGSAPAAAVAGDFNGDGKKDLAIATTGEASVKLALGTGGGAFAAVTAFPVASAGPAIAAADLDGDGKLDVVVANTTTASVSLLRGTGAGGFAAPTSLPVGAQPSSVMVVDLDGDTRPDIVVGNAGTSDVTVLHASGGGAFVGRSFGLGVPPTWICVADLDRDGHLDLAAASGNGFATLLYSGR